MDGLAPLTVVIVDNHEQVVKGLDISLQVWKEIEVVGTAYNAADGCNLCQQFAPQVLITNKVIQNENGSNLIQQIHHISPATRVIILGDFYELEMILEALNAGARGYILKQTTTLDGIFKAVTAVVTGKWVFCQEVYDLLPDKTPYQPYVITNSDNH